MTINEPAAAEQQRTLRKYYAVAVLATLAMDVVDEQIASDFLSAQLGERVTISDSISLLVVAALFAFLAFRPQKWGKFLAAFVGLTWLGFSMLVPMFALLPFAPPIQPTALLLVPFFAGSILIVIALIHQRLDQRS